MSLDLKKLEQLAKAATPGKWHLEFEDSQLREWPQIKGPPDFNNPHGIHICELRSFDYENAEYIASANPETMLALLDRIKKLEAVREAAISNQQTIGAIPWRTRYTNTDIDFTECTKSIFSTWMTTSMTALDNALKACEGGSDE